MSKIRKLLEEINNTDLSLEDRMKKIIEYEKKEGLIVGEEPVLVKNPKKELYLIMSMVEDKWRKFDTIIKYPIFTYKRKYTGFGGLAVLFSYDGNKIELKTFSSNGGYDVGETKRIIDEE